MKIANSKNDGLTECDGETLATGLYFCCICGEPVYPRNDLKKEHGRKREYYFAHYTESCSANLESYLHWIAKQIIAKSNEIALPGGRRLYTTAILECTTLHPGLRPDALLDDDLIVEVSYRNPKDEKHVGIFRELNISAIEVDISELNFNSTLRDITRMVIDEAANRKYLYRKTTVDNRTGSASEANSINPLAIIVGGLLAWLGFKELRKVITAKKNTPGKGRRMKPRKFIGRQSRK